VRCLTRIPKIWLGFYRGSIRYGANAGSMQLIPTFGFSSQGLHVSDEDVATLDLD
jgi:hypothetical protein